MSPAAVVITIAIVCVLVVIAFVLFAVLSAAGGANRGWRDE